MTRPRRMTELPQDWYRSSRTSSSSLAMIVRSLTALASAVESGPTLLAYVYAYVYVYA